MSNKQKQAGLWLLPAFFTFLAVIVVIVWIINPITGYSLQVVSEGTVIYQAPITQDHVEVDFRHSVNKGHIREIYRLDPKECRLALETGYFENYGAGMLDTVPAEVGFREEGNYLVLDFPMQYRDNITYRAGREAQHTLIYGNDVLRLYESIPQKPFTISIVANRLRNKLHMP
jgi:hypothetical protein